MVRVITQETFDNVVKENMEEFEMSREEAIQEAKQQFLSQGVNLNNIVISLNGSEDHKITEAIKSLQDLELQDEKVQENCTILSDECKKGLAEKMMANNQNAYQILIQNLDKHSDTSTSITKNKIISALISLLDSNPDPLNEEGLNLIRDGLKKSIDDEPSKNPSVKLYLDLILVICVRHEYNRQNVVRSGVLDTLDKIFEFHPVEIARIWQSLVQDDDVRVPFGKAHDHAREIVEDHGALSKITNILGNVKDNKDLKLLMSCLSSLTVRNEYCQAVVDKGGLNHILNLLEESSQSNEVVYESFKLLKALAGNDNVKKDIANTQGALLIILNAINNKITNKSVCGSGCGAIMAMCLRNTENSKLIMESNGASILTQIMKTHRDVVPVQISCAGAVRNIISRSKHYSKNFIELDIEDSLQYILKTHKSEKAQSAAKSALRDLGLKVELKERWTGEKGALETRETSDAVATAIL